MMRFIILLCALNLAACDIVNSRLQQPMRDGKAIGAGCYLSKKSLEVCYTEYDKIPKAYIYDGWIEMLEYTNKKAITIKGNQENEKPAETNVQQE